MPEGDTVWLTAHRLHRALAGALLGTAEFRVPALATVQLTGRRVSEVAAVGKHLWIRLDDDLSVHSHLRMDGRWWLRATGSTRRGGPDHMIRAVLGTDSWTAIGYRVHDLALIPRAEEHRLLTGLGPDIVAGQWAEGGSEAGKAVAVSRILAAGDRAIGAALLDQRNVAGIGNLYMIETLFISRVYPWKPAAAVNVAAVLDTARALMSSNLHHAAQSTTGLTSPGLEHWVYRRSGQPCRRCGQLILRSPLGAQPWQRFIYWCPGCQPGPIPAGTSSRRPDRRRRY